MPGFGDKVSKDVVKVKQGDVTMQDEPEPGQESGRQEGSLAVATTQHHSLEEQETIDAFFLQFWSHRSRCGSQWEGEGLASGLQLMLRVEIRT